MNKKLVPLAQVEQKEEFKVPKPKAPFNTDIRVNESNATPDVSIIANNQNQQQETSQADSSMNKSDASMTRKEQLDQ